MGSQTSLSLLWVLVACSYISSSVAYNSYHVGGKDGWVPNPSENYNHWAGRHRFQVNDSLVFQYKKGSDSVLLVTKDDYNSCNTKKPLKTMDSGSSVFQFDKSGSYFFISGNEDNCRKGQKLIVVVLSVRPKQTPKPPGSHPPAISPKAPSPGAHHVPSPASSKSPSPSAKPPTSSQVPSVSPISPSPSGKAPTGAPGLSPVPAKSSPPSANTPTLAPSPISEGPTGAPGPSPAAKTPQMSPVPSKSPASAPGSESSPSPLANPPAPAQPPKSPSPLASTPTPEESPSPSSSTPPSPSSSTPTPTPESSSAPSNSSNSNAGDVAPGAPPAAAWVATPPTVMVILASLLISSAIGVWS